LTEKELKEYLPICRQIERLQKKLDKVRDKDINVVKGKVRGSSTEFPYIETHMSVDMYEPKQYDVSKKKIKDIKLEIATLKKKKAAIEKFIDNIEKTETRLIFQYYFIDGMTQREIGEKLNLDRSGISKKINGYIKIHTFHKKGVL